MVAGDIEPFGCLDEPDTLRGCNGLGFAVGGLGRRRRGGLVAAGLEPVVNNLPVLIQRLDGVGAVFDIRMVAHGSRVGALGRVNDQEEREEVENLSHTSMRRMWICAGTSKVHLRMPSTHNRGRPTSS